MPEVLAEGDLVLPRYHGLSPMTGTHLDPLLRNEGISTVVVTGVSLNVAIPNLVFDAVNRSYQVVVVTDAVAGIPVEYGRQVVEYALRPLATLATTDDLLGIWAGPA
jgi:nicotinamidase-related amidase